MEKEKYVAYVGTYTHENSIGIHLYDVDIEKGQMTERKVVPINNPSDLIVSNSGKYLYSIADEGVEAFSIEKNGDLTPINEKWIGGMRGCYVELDEKDRYLFVGGYHDGRVTMMRLNEDGSIEGIADGIFHKGIARSIAQRNYAPHVTCVKVTPDQKFLCAVDSGLDHTKIYRIDYENGKLKLADIVRSDIEAAPRMIRFGRDGKKAYVLCELGNTVDVYNYSTKNDQPVFERIQQISTLGKKEDAEICAASGMEVSMDGRYLFVSNAGTNTVVIYEIDKESGQLTRICGNLISGDYPKTLGIYPNDKFFVSLNNETNEMTTFHVNYEEHTILMTGKPVKVDKPNCIYIHKLNE